MVARTVAAGPVVGVQRSSGPAATRHDFVAGLGVALPDATRVALHVPAVAESAHVQGTLLDRTCKYRGTVVDHNYEIPDSRHTATNADTTHLQEQQATLSGTEQLTN